MSWRNLFGLLDKKPDIVTLTNEDFEFLEININGQDLTPGNISDIVLPNARMNCVAMQGLFNNKWTFIYATGGIKIVAILRSEMKEKEKI